ncbi:MAG: PD-(D/E)XK nuclease family protein [Clostridiales bacterium]|nr:PD-(D/E)XK nuclease family protein [Candidatus Cacconaster stercorequi]
MLSIWIGRAGSGKSARVLNTMAAHRGERPQILMVPEHVSHEAEVDLCHALGATASRDAEVLSFRNLATRVLSQTGGLADVALDNGGKLLTMRLALQEVHTALKVFGRPSQRAAFLRQLTELMDEFYAYEIAPETLYEQVSEVEGAMGDKLRDVALLYAAYDARLHADGSDARSRVQKLRDALGQSDYLRGKDIYFDGFAYFNKTEESILRCMLQQANSVTVTLLGEKGNDTLFENAVRQRQRLERMAREAGVPCEIVWMTAPCDTALQHLERHFFGADAIWEGDAHQIKLYEAGTAFTEVEYMASRVLELVHSGKCRFRDICVTARSMELYGPLVETIFERSGVPAYYSHRSDILEKAPLRMLLSAVDAVTGGFEYEDMFRYLKTGLAGITEQECDLLENYAITWEIRGNMWLREAPWTANPDGYGVELTPDRADRLEEINRIREKVRQPLLYLSDGMKFASSMQDKAEILYRFADMAGVPQTLEKRADALLAAGEVQLAEENAQLWQIFCDVLDQMVKILGESEVDGEEFARLLRLVLTEYSVGTIPATLDQVKVSELSRNDRHTVKYLFLLGCNDHLLPQVTTGGGILDDEAREALQQREIMLADATFDTLDNEMQNIYACLAQATEGLQISWPVTDVSGGELRPAFPVERIRKLFPEVTPERETQDYLLTMPVTALELAGREGTLRQYFAASGQYAPVLAGMERARHMERGRLSPAAVQALYGKTIRMSASRMNQVKSCHFGYFMEYGLRAKERRSAGFEAPEIGTFIHYLLENVNRDVMAQGGYGTVEEPELRRLVDHYVEEYAACQIDKYQEKSARFRYLFRRLRSAAYAVIENIAAEMKESDFTPMAFELGFGGGGELPAITIREGDTTLSVSGKVDRVDGWLHDGKLYLRVVDYKTGKKAFDLSDVQYGLSIQMLLYLFTLEDHGADYFGHPIVPAGVLYMPARDVILRTERGISREKLREAMEKELRRSGMVLQEPEVLRAMEHSALESPCYLPMQVKKDGSISGGLATAAQWGKLGKYVEKLLHQIADELARGNIDADPCTRGPQDSACTYCEFATACYFQEGRDHARHLKKTTPAEFWQFVDRTNGEEAPHGN